MKSRLLCKRGVDSSTTSPMYHELLALREEIAKEVQVIYDSWEHDESGSGGIDGCDIPEGFEVSCYISEGINTVVANEQTTRW